MRRRSFSYIMFLFLGLYVVGGSLIPDAYRDYLFIAIVIIVPTFGRLIKNNARKQDNQHRRNETSFDNLFHEQVSSTRDKNLVECPYCSHMNPEGLTFCEKCNGLL